MPIQEILLLGNPTLQQKCSPVKDWSDPSIKKTIDDLRDTLANFKKTHGFGRGIAAPQIGISKQIIFINIFPGTTDNQQRPLINPKIIKRSKQQMLLWDDCFSFPEILVKVKRALNITVQYEDERGKRHQFTAGGALSELLQHEIDHINGILAIDRPIDSHHIILRSEYEKRYKSNRRAIML